MLNPPFRKFTCPPPTTHKYLDYRLIPPLPCNRREQVSVGSNTNIYNEMTMGDTNPGVVSREQVLAVIRDNEGVSCCLPFCKQTNRVLPSLIKPTDSEFYTFKASRKIRIIHRLPKPGCPSSSLSRECQSQAETLEETLTEDDDDEDYWFENAAPNRLPVIQPPPPIQMNRIINKFEPQAQPNISPKSLDDDLISPGRLPRKNFNTDTLQDTDDYEDEQKVSTDENNEPSLKDEPSDYALSAIFNESSGMILGITAESTEKIVRNSPIINFHLKSSPSESSPASSRSTSPVTVINAAPDSLSSQRSKTPPLDKPATPTRSPEAADDSCHPSPEVPHRTVCASPDPSEDKVESDNFSSIIVTGSNLGGIANPGFSADEDQDNLENTDTVLKDDIKDTDVDAGYSRVRNIDKEAIENSLADLAEAKNPNFELKDMAAEVSPPKNNKPIIFFIHGVGGSADIWNSQLQFFVNRGYEVIAPDMLGHGFSSCPDKASAYTFTKLFKDIITIFDTYVPEDRKCVVIGHSYGCSFSAALARTRPDQIVSLIMIASGGPTPLAPPPNLSKYPAWMMSFIQLALKCKFRSQQHKYNPRGKTIKFREAFDVPSYVFKYIMLGQVKRRYLCLLSFMKVIITVIWSQ